MIRSLNNGFLLLILFYLMSCGVKGDPLPPIDPPDLGRGRPSFTGATKGIEIKEAPMIESEEDESKKNKK